MSTPSKPRGKAMYVATKTDRDWLLNEQQKVYARSFELDPPSFAVKSMESPVHNERCTPGSGTGAS